MHASTGEGKDRCIILRRAETTGACSSPVVEGAEESNEERLDHVARQEREAERRRVQKEQQLHKKMQMQHQKQQQQEQKQRQQLVMSGASFLLDSSPSSAAPGAEDGISPIVSAPAIAPASEAPSVVVQVASLPTAIQPPQSASPSSSGFMIGQSVRLSGLSTDWLNGAQGVVASPLDGSTGRYLVKIHAPKEVSVKCNVRNFHSRCLSLPRVIFMH